MLSVNQIAAQNVGQKCGKLPVVHKVLVQPGLGNNGRNFGRNLNLNQTSYLLIYKCEVAKLGSKAGNFFSGKRGVGWGERDRESKT